MSATFIDEPRYWRSALLPGGELLTAQFRQHAFAPHWHDTYVVPVIEAGAQSYRYRGAELIAGPGHIAVINPGEVHTGKRAADGGWAYRAFYPPVMFLQKLAQDVADRPQTVPWLPDDTLSDPQVAGRLLRAHRLLAGGADPLLAETALIGAFSLLLSRHAGVKQHYSMSCRDRVRVALMQSRLREEIGEPVTLTDLARVVGLSAHHASHLFTSEVGMPPHAWRNQLRLERAVQMLRRQIPVVQVATACGFADQSHFTRHFRRAYGVPPGRWQVA